MEFNLLKKYACGDNLSDEEHEKLFDFIMIPISRTRNINYKRIDEVLEAFGVQVSFDEKGNKKFILRENKLPIIKAETWEYIIIDLLKQPAMNIINRFDFASTFIRHVKNSLDINELQFNLGAWKFSDDKSEQSLSNVRMKFDDYISDKKFDLESKILLMRKICDHISGMTDHYAIEEYEKLYG